MFSHISRGLGSLSSSCQRISILWGPSFWFVDGHLLPVSSHGLPCGLTSSYRDSSHRGFRAYPNDLISTLLQLQK